MNYLPRQKNAKKKKQFAAKNVVERIVSLGNFVK